MVCPSFLILVKLFIFLIICVNLEWSVNKLFVCLLLTVEYFPTFDYVSSQQPSLNWKPIEIFQSLRICKIFKNINSFCPLSMHIFQKCIYFKFQTHEPNSNDDHMWLIYRVNMNSLERQSVEFSKFTDIPELFPTMDLMCPWNFNLVSTNIPKSLH